MLLEKKTQSLLLLFLAGSLLGCVTPKSNSWDSIEVPTEAIEAPLPCAELPAPQSFDELGQGRIQAMRECAVANYDIASEHVTQIENMREAAGHLVDAGQAQRQIAEMRQEMLADERRHNLWTSVGYWVIIVALGAAL